jgi:hypothetical protein
MTAQQGKTIQGPPGLASTRGSTTAVSCTLALVAGGHVDDLMALHVMIPTFPAFHACAPSLLSNSAPFACATTAACTTCHREANSTPEVALNLWIRAGLLSSCRCAALTGCWCCTTNMTPACQLPHPNLTPQSCLRCGWDSVKHAKPPVQLIRPDRNMQTAKLRHVRHPAAVRSDSHRQQEDERQQAAPSQRDVETTEAASPEDNADVEAARGPGVR